jgi:uncharacterized protein (DUF433 family)
MVSIQALRRIAPENGVVGDRSLDVGIMPTWRDAHPVDSRSSGCSPPGYNRDMTVWQQHLGSDPAICGGDLCARGTRIPVTVILDNPAEGSSRDEILKSYPALRPEHIEDVLAYAAELVHEERLVLLQVG